MIPPEDFLCNVAATGVSLLAREHAKDFALQSDCLVTFTKLIAPGHVFCTIASEINTEVLPTELKSVSVAVLQIILIHRQILYLY